MIKAFWFMLKVGVVVAIAIWVADHPGFVYMEFDSYDTKIRVNTGLFLLGLLITILLAIFIYRIISGLVRIPHAIEKYMQSKRQEKGYRALTLGLTAVAAGDTKHAAYHAYRASRFMPEDKGLPLLLNAQAARMKGDEDEARDIFAQLAQNKDTSFLGVRGLLQSAMDAGDHEKALQLAQGAREMHPEQPWIVNIVYDLHIQSRDWKNARKILNDAVRMKAIDADQAKSDRVAMLLLSADEELKAGFRVAALKTLKRAQKMGPCFVPTIERLAKMYIQDNHRARAQRVVEKAWKAEDHPELARIWGNIIPPHKSGDAKTRMAWFEKLFKMRPESAEALLALGNAAIEHKLWGEARDYLKRSVELHPGARAYKLLARLEEQSGQSDMAANAWLEKAANAQPGKRWVCRETGRIYDHWAAIAPPHDSFNTIEWQYPHGLFGNDQQALLPHGPANDDEDKVLLESPA